MQYRSEQNINWSFQCTSKQVWNCNERIVIPIQNATEQHFQQDFPYLVSSFIGIKLTVNSCKTSVEVVFIDSRDIFDMCTMKQCHFVVVFFHRCFLSSVRTKQCWILNSLNFCNCWYNSVFKTCLEVTKNFLVFLRWQQQRDELNIFIAWLGIPVRWKICNWKVNIYSMISALKR